MLIILSFIVGCSRNMLPTSPEIESMIHGKIIDQYLKVGIADAQILSQENIIARSDSNGYFEIDILLLKTIATDNIITLKRFPYKPVKILVDQLLMQTPPDTFRLELPRELKNYQYLLDKAKKNGYRIVPVVEWFRNYEQLKNERVVIMRHDVDQDTVTAMALGFIEHQLKCRSSFYYRWCTASHKSISYIKSLGHELGLHYETLSDYGVKNHINQKSAVTPEVIQICRNLLKLEIQEFEALFGNIFSIAAHGAGWNKTMGIPNFALMQGENPADYGIETWAYSPEVKDRASIYISDSGDKWTPISFEDGINRQYQSMYVLVHPLWWNND
jgi:hypothetical protein